MSDPRLFVYGTLMHGGERAGLLGAALRQRATLQGRLYHLPAGYPALELGTAGTVHGELVDAPSDRVLALLDHIEGVADGLFVRSEVDVTLGLRRVRAWVFAMDAPRLRGGRLIPNGRWVQPRQ